LALGNAAIVSDRAMIFIVRALERLRRSRDANWLVADRVGAGRTADFPESPVFL
jgi:hypothetical protein